MRWARLHSKKQKISLTDGPISKALFFLALPIMAGNILQAAYQLTDAFWVGRLGAEAVAAVSISFPINFLLIALGMGFSVSGSILVAQYMGAKNYAKVNHTVAQTILATGIVSLALSVAGFFAAPAILSFMGVSSAVYEGALGFLRVSFAGTIFVFGFAVFQSVLRGVGEVRMPMIIIFCTVLLNFLLDPLFIFGYGKIPAMGVSGAAMATFITQAIAVIVGFWFLFGGKYGIQLVKKDFRPDLVFIKKSFLLGFPASVEQSVRAFGFIAMTFLVTGFGTETTAVYGIGTNVLQLIVIPALGISMATSTLAGQAIGAGNRKRAEGVAWLSSVLSFCLLSFLGVFVFVFSEAVVGFFVPNDPLVIQGGVEFIRIISPSFGFLGFQMALSGVLRAAGSTFATMVLALISLWGIQFPVALVLSRYTPLGESGIWWAFPASYIIVSFMALFWFLRGDWKKHRLTETEELEDIVSEEILIEEGTR